MAMVYAAATGVVICAVVWASKAANRVRAYRRAAAVAGRVSGWLAGRAALCGEDERAYGCAAILEAGYEAPQRSEILRSWLDLH